MKHRSPHVSANRIARVVLGIVCTFAVSPCLANGLPEEYLVTGRWRTLNAPYSPLNNPAFLTEANYITARLASTTTLGTYYYHEAGATVPLGLYQSVGFTWFFLGSQAIDGTRFDGSRIIPTNISSGASHNYFMATYAINPIDRLSLGVNLNLLYASMFKDTSYAGVGADAALSYRVLRNAMVGDHVAGITMQNLLSPKEGATELPRAIRISLMSSYWEKRIESSLEYTIKDLFANATEFTAAPTMESDIDARVGGWIFRLAKLYAMAGLHTNGSSVGFSYWGFAIGANLPTINQGRDLSMVYQFMQMPGSAALSHTGYLRAEFGLHREEIWARKMARLASLGPNDLYNRALGLYSNRQFWDAYFIFGRLCAEYPDFFKQDWVSYYMSSCQEELDMRNSSIAGYLATKSAYPKSLAIPYADLGLMRVYYREGRDSDVGGQFQKLDNPDVPDTLRFHAYYIMGQSLIRQGNLSRAATLLGNIPETHPQYIFARHALGHIAVMTEKVPEAVSIFESIFSLKASTPAQKEMVNRSFLMHAFLLYENVETEKNALARAVVSLRAIPKSSYYYEDAQLGLGWSAARVRQWKDCMEAGDALSKTSAKAVLQAEGGLLKGYAQMMTGDNAGAMTTLTEAAAKVDTAAMPSQDSLEKENSQFRVHRESYDTLAENARTFSLTRQSAFVVAKIDSLSGIQKQLKKSIDQHYVFLDELDRLKLFSIGAANIKEDINYSIARVKKVSATKDQGDTKKKAVDTQKDLESEIQKLQEEMKKIDQKK